jgi:hypothetical protein
VPVFDPAVFDGGVFDAGSAAWGATITATGALSGALATGIQLGATLAATSTFGGPLVTDFNMQATMVEVATLSGPLIVARFVGILQQCGHPILTAFQDWLIK